MKKGTPHCKLAVVKRLIALGQVRMTFSAATGGQRLGFSAEQIVQTVNNLAPTDFYKSMTTHDDHTIWQDVYRPRFAAGTLYLKITVIDDLLIVSFKEL